jgi:hypothetical protein
MSLRSIKEKMKVHIDDEDSDESEPLWL